MVGANEMIANADKNKSIIVKKPSIKIDDCNITVGNQEIKPSSSVKFIVADIDNKLNFRKHIKTLRRKVFQNPSFTILKYIVTMHKRMFVILFFPKCPKRPKRPKCLMGVGGCGYTLVCTPSTPDDGVSTLAHGHFRVL